MHVKYIAEDMYHALVTEDSKYPAGHELNRVGFGDEAEAKKVLEAYAKGGKWPNPPKNEEETEKDV
jgi:hypothetical protein